MTLLLGALVLSEALSIALVARPSIRALRGDKKAITGSFLPAELLELLTTGAVEHITRFIEGRLYGRAHVVSR